jgi:hypothetical protein
MLYTVVLTVMAAAVNVQANTPVQLQPSAVIELHGTTEKAAASACTRVSKALAASGVISFCSPEATKTAEVSTK